MTILVLQPIRSSNPRALRARADALLERMCAINPGLDVVQQDDSAIDILPHPSKYMRHATVRNYMLDTYLRAEHTHVLWVDSDLIDYPAALPALLMGVGSECGLCGGKDFITQVGTLRQCMVCKAVWKDAIVAPMAVLDPSPARLKVWPNPEQFYDIGGFVEKGRRARMEPPWFDQAGDVIELDSVGCCYLAPAALYRDGVRYKPPITEYYVEHWSVMQAARKRGYRICALTNVRAIHAWLPDYGMEAN